MRIAIVILSVLACAILPVEAAAPAPNPQEQVDQQTITSAMSLFTLGKQAGDVDVVRAFLWADNDADRAIADAQAHRIIADYALYRTAAEKFGDGASFKMIQRFNLSTPDGIALCSTSWKIDGDKATPADDTMGDLRVMLHNVKGIWKIDVSGASAARSPDAVRKQADAVAQIAKDLAGGKYHGIPDVENALTAANIKPAK